jgi:hypothetical protein
MSWCFIQGKRRRFTMNNISMEQNPSSEAGSLSATESFDSVHKGPADVPVLIHMRSVNLATSYSAHF